jgi:hypothetical protein
MKPASRKIKSRLFLQSIEFVPLPLGDNELNNLKNLFFV